MSVRRTERALLGRRRFVIAAAATGGLFLTGAGSYYALARREPTAERERFDGASEEIVLGDLEGTTTVTGTLRFASERTVTAGTGGTVTELPAPGAVLTRGERLYAIDDAPAFLLKGELPAWREFTSGMDDGPDVKQLEENLRDLGHFSAEPDQRFRWSTTKAVMDWQEEHDLPETGELAFGSVVFAEGDLRVGELHGGIGEQVGPGAELFTVTGTEQVVEAQVKLGDQGLAVLGTAVTVRLPGGGDVPGTITSVGTPTEVEGGDGRPRSVIPIGIALEDPEAAAQFQQASVSVDLPSARREGVLSVPVGALIAITADQFGVERVESDGTTTQVPVETGLFADGRVEISGEGIAAGQRVVVPQR